MPKITTRPAQAEDVAQLHPEARGASYLAWVAELDGRPAGTIGLALTRPRACLFCSFDESLRPHLKAMPLLRLLKRVHTLVQQRARPVYALRDRREDQAPAILARLGFALVGWSGGMRCGSGVAPTGVGISPAIPPNRRRQACLRQPSSDRFAAATPQPNGKATDHGANTPHRVPC